MPSNVSGGIFSIVVIIVLVAGCISPQPANQTEQIPAGMENPGTNSAKTVVNGQTSFVVAQGDTFSSTYIDPLRPDTEVNEWVFGNDTVSSKQLTSDADGSLAFGLDYTQTLSLTPGPYVIILQYPPSGSAALTWPANSFSGLVTAPNGSVLFTIHSITQGRETGFDAAKILENQLNQGCDELANVSMVSIETPWIRIDPISDHVIGDKFTITGTTDLAPGDNIFFTVISNDTHNSCGSTNAMCNEPMRYGEWNPPSPTISVCQGQSGNNTWLFDIDTAAFMPEEYFVTVTAVGPQYDQSSPPNATAQFRVYNNSAITPKHTAPTVVYREGSSSPVAPVASFISFPTTGVVPLTVQFTDTSTGSPTSWNWSFGDGNFSTIENPSYTYTSAGLYSVSLNVTNNVGSSIKAIQGYIDVTSPASTTDT